MQFEPSEPPAAVPGIEAIPGPARRTLHNLGVDQVAVEVLEALDAAGVGAVLLKGPSVARWLYETGARTYVDVDLLIAPGDRSAAEKALIGLGFTTASPPTLPLDRPAYQEWTRLPEEPAVDLHPTLNLLEQLPPAMVWEAVARNSERFELLGREVSILAPGPRAFHVAVHALAHREKSPQAQEDLARAISSLGAEVWEAAADFARELRAEALLGIALSQHPKGEELATRLALPRQGDVAVSLRGQVPDEAERSAALAVGWWSDLTGVDKIRLLIPKMFPSPRYLRARSRWAQRGGPWLIAAYVARPFVVLGWGMRGLTIWMKARRRHR